MLHTNAILGRAFLPTDDGAGAPPVLVISYNVWQERYAGQASVIGRQVRLDGQQATIVGVLPDGFRFPSSTDAWMPLVPTAELAKRDHRTLREFAMLKPGVSIKEANAQMDAVAERLAKQYPEDKRSRRQRADLRNQRFNGGNIFNRVSAHAGSGRICAADCVRGCGQPDVEPFTGQAARDVDSYCAGCYAVADCAPVAD